MKIKYLLVCLAACSMFAGGCATKIKVTSDPAGAMIRYRGEGRASYRWKTAPKATPCEFDVYYGRISAYAIWPDGAQGAAGSFNAVKSEPQEVSLSAFRDVEALHFTKPGK